jgi:hypothetical protein
MRDLWKWNKKLNKETKQRGTDNWKTEANWETKSLEN